MASPRKTPAPSDNGTVRFPYALVTAAAVTMLCLMVWSRCADRIALADYQSRLSRHTRIASKSARILHLNDVLSMSARLAAATGDKAWIARHHHFVPELSRAIRETADLAASKEASKQLARTEKSNRNLILMEMTSFELVLERRQRQAFALLTGPEYLHQKAIYTSGVDAFLREIASEEKSDTSRAVGLGTLQFAARLTLNVLVVTLWFLALWSIRLAWKRKAENARQSECRLSTTLDSIGDGVISTDARGRVVRMNPVAEELTGWTLQEAVGRPISGVLNIVSSLTHQPAAIPVDEVLATGQVRRLANHTTLISRDGAQRQIADSAAPVRDSSGAITGVVLVFSDVSEQKRAENALREGEAYLHTLVQTIPDLVWLKDKNGVFLSCNTMFARFLGAGEADIIGKTDYDFVDRELADFFRENDRKAMEAGKPTSNEEWITFAGDGHRALLETTKTPMHDARGVLIGVLGIGRDITERKRAERCRQLSADILGILNEPVALGDAINRVVTAIKRETEFDAVGLRLQSGDGFPYLAQYGFNNDFLGAEDSLVVSDTQDGACRDGNGNVCLECTCGLVLRRQTDPTNPLFTAGGSFWTNNSSLLLDILADQDSGLHPRNRCIREGFDSIALIPIRANQDIVGILHLSSREEGRLTLDMVEHLEDTGASIGLALLKRQADEHVRQSEEQYRVILEGSAHGILITDSETHRFVYANPSICKMLGYTKDELLQLGVADIHPKESLDRVASEMGSLSRGEGPIDSAVLPCLRKDGTLFYADVTPAVTTREGRRCNVGFFTDVTERLRAERRQLLSTEVLGILNEPVALDNAINRVLTAVKRETGFDAVGLRLKNGDDYPYFAQNGLSDDFLLAENTLVETNNKGAVCRHEDGSISLECTCGLVISGQTDPANHLFTPRGSCWTNNSLPLLDMPADQDPRRSPRNRCIHEGFLSVALIPIRANQEIVGLLQLSDRKKDRLTLETVHYFEDISASIGLVLTKKQAETALRESEEKYRVIFEGSAQGIVILDAERRRITYANPAICRMFGYTEAEALQLDVTDIHPKDSLDRVTSEFEAQIRGEKTVASEIPCLCKDGTLMYADVTSTLSTYSGGRECTVGFFADVTDRKRATDELLRAKAEIEAVNRQLEEALLASREHAAAVEIAKDKIEEHASELRHQATHDALTGLPNRTCFGQRLSELISGSTGKKSRSISMLFLDLDKFKMINDTLGHKVGDALLVEVAGRLRSCLRQGDLLARMGGDEFTIMLPRCRSRSTAQSVASRMIDSLSRAFEIQGHRFVIGASIGLASYPSDGTDAVTLLKHADAAMYRAKQAGRGTFRWFTGDVDVDNQQRADMEMDIRGALEKSQFSVCYQPIVSLADGSIVAAEALLRWEHPEKGMVSPSLFIPIAEEIGVIGRIGDYVLRTACAQIVAWRSEGIHLAHIGVNVSTRQVRDPEWINSLRAALSDTGLDARCLNLEVTETDFASGYESMRETLQKVQELGICLSIDDFGIGQSSLSRLKDFPVIHLKIDGSFIRDIEHNKSDNSLVRSIVEMAHGQGIEVTAEWVETESQMEILRSIGCDLAQGYLISPALSPEAFEYFVRTWQEKRSLEQAA